MERGGSVESAVRAGRKDSRDAHSASLPALGDAACGAQRDVSPLRGSSAFDWYGTRASVGFTHGYGYASPPGLLRRR